MQVQFPTILNNFYCAPPFLFSTASLPQGANGCEKIFAQEIFTTQGAGFLLSESARRWRRFFSAPCAAAPGSAPMHTFAEAREKLEADRPCEAEADRHFAGLSRHHISSCE
jgi:hypothetical protein